MIAIRFLGNLSHSMCSKKSFWKNVRCKTQSYFTILTFEMTMCTYEINNIHFQSSYKKQWILFDNLHWKLSDHLVLRGNIFENLGRFLQNICKKFVKLNQIVAVIQFGLLSAVLYLIFNFVQDYQSVVWPSHLKTGHWKIWDHMFIKKNHPILNDNQIARMADLTQ